MLALLWRFLLEAMTVTLWLGCRLASDTQGPIMALMQGVSHGGDIPHRHPRSWSSPVNVSPDVCFLQRDTLGQTDEPMQ